MPADFLLPLFALTLIANAVLVAVAIRDIRRGRAEAARDAASWATASIRAAVDRPSDAELARAIALREISTAESVEAGPHPVPAAAIEPVDDRAAPSPEPANPEGAVPVSEPPTAEPAAPRGEPAADVAAPRSEPRDGEVPRETEPADASAEPEAKPVGKRTTRTSPPTAPVARPAAGAGRRGRRRFSLPPLDEDHERVSRSIETFLAGGEAAVDAAADGSASDAATADPSPGAPPRASSTDPNGATTVALVAVDGLPRPRRGRSASIMAEDDAVADALAMVERTLRGAARASDVVTVTARGRYRIVLPATGELAARAYLRRIRATVEPLLEGADHPLHLATATATVLDEPIGAGIRLATARLGQALATTGQPGPTATDRAEPAADRPIDRAAVRPDEDGGQPPAPRAAGG